MPEDPGAGTVGRRRTGGPHRPALKAGVRRLGRGPGRVQLGVDPERAVVLTGLDEAGERWLAHIDGFLERERLLEAAAEAGVAPDAAADILDLLDSCGLLDDAAAGSAAWAGLPGPERDRLRPDLASLALAERRADGGHAAMARRLTARVDVHGGGRVGASAAALLAAAGVGTVRVVDHTRVTAADLAPAGLRPADLGAPRGWAATRAAAATTCGPPRPRPARPDLVLLAAEGPVPPGLREAVTGAAVPHLVAGVRETTGVVGPLVVPRRTSCLFCHDLIRAERDPGWPLVAAQLATEPAPQADPRHVRPCDSVLATAVASHAALQVLTFLDGGEPATLDGTLEIALPEGTVRRRSWQRHPACGCGWAC
jgi:hypothetical protein